MAYDLGDGGRHGDREGGLRRQDLVALSREQPDFEVDDGPLYPRAAYVHAKAKNRHARELNGRGGTGRYNLTLARVDNAQRAVLCRGARPKTAS